MLQYSDVQYNVESSVQTPQLITVQYVLNLNNDNSNINFTDSLSNETALNTVSKTKIITKKDIYVCTFCQVFSPNFVTVANHISTVHFESLPAGTKPDNFVSKLEKLEENSQKKKGKVGRPRKTQVTSIIPEKTKEKVVDPVPDSKGLFWCKTCLRFFRKCRQLLQHICLDPEGEVSSEESCVELDDDVEFRTHMNIDPAPWSRSKKLRKFKENSANINFKSISTEDFLPDSNNKITENKVIPNWRNDPSYIPLFGDEKEKAAFEEHLKSIDYSYVDNFFKMDSKRKKGKNCINMYSCNFCKKACKSLSVIRAHCLTHTDLKPFTCPKCSYSTNAVGSLYMHMRKHTGNVFQCSFCDFKCIKRSHLLDHEATHSTVYQICKLCKNSYKTVRSLVAHVRKYHNYAGGRRYMKSLTCKQSSFKCDICNKKFKSLTIFNNHNHACHEIAPALDRNITEDNISELNSEKINGTFADIEMQIHNINNVELSTTDLQCNDIQSKDPLADIVLNDFLQQQSETIMYQNVFSHAGENIISPSNNNLLNGFQAESIGKQIATESSILEECQKTLDLDILEECLHNRGFSNKCQDFNLIPNISRKHSLQDNLENNPNVSGDLNEMSEDKLEEPKSVEIKLFEKCQQTPAYVCCVCSSIYICTATLKAHLKEHVNSTIIMDQTVEQFEPAKITETSNELDVCEILQDSSESFSFDKELEKLYTSSLDMMYYLPEVSVVLQNEAFDFMLDDISNFPISDNPSQDLSEKVVEESVLKCFPGMQEL